MLGQQLSLQQTTLVRDPRNISYIVEMTGLNVKNRESLTSFFSLTVRSEELSTDFFRQKSKIQIKNWNLTFFH